MTGSSTDYEVRCFSCDVSFPVGQKRCIHCGGVLGSRGVKELGFTPAEGFKPSGIGYDSQEDTEALGPVSGSSSVTEEASEASEAPVGRFGFLRGGMTLIWIVLAGLYSILRACGEG